MQKIGQNDYEKRLHLLISFSRMTDKAHFYLNGFVNEQNFRYRGVENSII